MYSLITGASSGIGKEVSYQLADIGYDLILVARRTDHLNIIKNDLVSKGAKVHIFSYDLSLKENCSKLIDDIKEFDVKLFLNCAGFGFVGYSDNKSTSIELSMIYLNIVSLLFLTKEFIKHFNGGIIVNVSSMAAFLPTPLMAVYAATKAYVYNFSVALNYELKKKGSSWKLLTVVPGPVKTEFAEVAHMKQKMKGISASKCAKIIVRGIEKRKELIIPGFSMKLIKFFLRFIPKRFILAVSYKIQNRK